MAASKGPRNRQMNPRSTLSPMTNTDEFLRESRRIDQLIWDAMSLLRGERVLFLGYGNDVAWVRRANEIGVLVSVLESDETKIGELADLGVRLLRGSPTMIPARDESFDAIVAFHYLHEIDPTFHAQVVSELARVGRRVVVVEPAPPSDALGKRIAQLYQRAKYEAGAFEEYQPIDYWRKLLAMVKADVLMQQFTFTRLAPRFAVEETVDLILETMTVEQMPQNYLDELRELARRPDAQLSPLSRYVLVALAAGEPVRAKAGTLFREEPIPAPARESLTADPIAGAAAAAAAASAAAGSAPPPVAQPGTFTAYRSEEAEFPPVLPPPGAAPRPVAGAGPAVPPAPEAPSLPAPPQPGAPPAAPVPSPAANAAPPAAPFGIPSAPATSPEPFGLPGGPEPAFGLPDPTPFGAPPRPNPNASPFGTPFALPDDPDPFGLTEDPEQRAGFGWTWEPPEGHSNENPFDASDPFGTKGS